MLRKLIRRRWNARVSRVLKDPADEACVFACESAQATIEWVLLLAVIIVPSTALIFELMASVGRFYSITSWVVALPFP